MRRSRLLAAFRTIAVLALGAGAAGPAWAQATVDPRALDQLAPQSATRPAAPQPTATKPAASKPAAIKPAPAKQATKPPTTKPAATKPAATKPATTRPGATKPGAAPPVKPAPLVVPPAPPAAPVLPPPIIVPTRPPPPPTPTPIAPDAPGAASRQTGGIRVTFGPDRADLNPDSAAAITALARAAPGPDSSYTITAFAPGGDDPSTPRRLSLSRALAVRSALMQAGVPSVRIYVKALGASAPAISAGPADRVDIVVTAAQMPAETNAAATPPVKPPSDSGDMNKAHR